jgi:hypothetical protein
MEADATDARGKWNVEPASGQAGAGAGGLAGLNAASYPRNRDKGFTGWPIACG